VLMDAIERVFPNLEQRLEVKMIGTCALSNVLSSMYDYYLLLQSSVCAVTQSSADAFVIQRLTAL
jgi:hypothetical protein